MASQQRVEERWPLPPGWSWVSLETVADVEVGYPKATSGRASQEGTIPLILSGDLRNSKTIDITRYVTQKDYESIVGPGSSRKRKDRRQEPGRKLLVAAARETTGRIGILDAEKAVFNNVVFALIPKEHIRLDYLFYYFLMESTRLYIRERLTTGPRTYTKSGLFRQKMPVPLPPLDQGNTLALQDRIIERIETLTRAATQGQERLTTMQTDLLDAFSNLLGQLFASLAAAWPIVPLRDLITIREGQRYRNLPGYRQAPYITPGSIISGIGVHQQYLPFAGAHSEEEKGRFLLLRNDGATVLYVCEQPGNRRAVMMDQEIAVYSRVSGIVPLSIKDKERLLPAFLLYALLTPDFTRFALANLRVASIPRVSRATLLSYPLPLPSREEQESITNYLNNNRQLIESAQMLLADDASAIERAQSAILEKAFQGGL